MKRQQTTGQNFLNTRSLSLVSRKSHNQSSEEHRNVLEWLKNRLPVMAGNWRAILNNGWMLSEVSDVPNHHGTNHQEIALVDLKSGQRGIIVRIDTADSQHLQKLMAMGVMPGEDISLLRRFPSFIFEVNYSQFAVDKEIASRVFVQLMYE